MLVSVLCFAWRQSVHLDSCLLVNLLRIDPLSHKNIHRSRQTTHICYSSVLKNQGFITNTKKTAPYYFITVSINSLRSTFKIGLKSQILLKSKFVYDLFPRLWVSIYFSALVKIYVSKHARRFSNLSVKCYIWW